MYFKTIPMTIFCFTATLLATTPARASDDSPLSFAASEYRQAVRELERSVLRSRLASRHQERVADDLEDSTSRLVSAARNPHKSDRLFRAWQETQYLHQRVEADIFFDPYCPLAIELAGCWYRVQHAYERVAYQVAVCRWHPGYRHPPIFVPPVTQFPGSNHPSQWNPNRIQNVAPYQFENPQVNFRRFIQYGNRTPDLGRGPNHRSNNGAAQVGANLQRLSR